MFSYYYNQSQEKVKLTQKNRELLIRCAKTVKFFSSLGFPIRLLKIKMEIKKTIFSTFLFNKN